MAGLLAEKFQKRFVLGSIVGVIGTVIGVYFSFRLGNYIYAGIGAVIGAVLGELLGLLIHEKVTLRSLVRTDRLFSIGIGILNLLMALVAIIHLYISHHWSGLAGAVFFGAIGVFLIRK